MKNFNGDTMQYRMRVRHLPTHRDFYSQNNFGAMIGYDDHTSLVILLEESISRVDFLALP